MGKEPFRVVNRKNKRQCVAHGCKNLKSSKRRFCTKHQKRWQKAMRPESYYYDKLKSNARRRGCFFDLTLDQFKNFCEETGYLKKKGRRSQSYHIDRIDIKKGYTEGNLQILTNLENVMKQHNVDYSTVPF